MDVHVYTFEDADGNAVDSYSTQDYQNAREYAAKSNLKVIDNTFEWADSEMVDDFTGSDDNDE